MPALVAPGRPDWLDLAANDCPNDAISKKNDLLIDDLPRRCLPRSLCNDASCLRSSFLYSGSKNLFLQTQMLLLELLLELLLLLLLLLLPLFLPPFLRWLQQKQQQ